MKPLQEYLNESLVTEGFSQKDAEEILGRFLNHFDMTNDCFFLDKPHVRDAGEECYHFTTDWWEGARLQLFVFDGDDINARIAVGNEDEQFAVIKHGSVNWEDWNNDISHYGVRIHDWEELDPKELSKIF